MIQQNEKEREKIRGCETIELQQQQQHVFHSSLVHRYFACDEGEHTQVNKVRVKQANFEIRSTHRPIHCRKRIKIDSKSLRRGNKCHNISPEICFVDQIF